MSPHTSDMLTILHSFFNMFWVIDWFNTSKLFNLTPIYDLRKLFLDLFKRNIGMIHLMKTSIVKSVYFCQTSIKKM